MFWAIVAGIMSGAGVYFVAIVSSLALGLLYFISFLFNYKTGGQYLLVIRYQGDLESQVVSEIKKIKKYRLKTKSLVNNLNELTYEVEVSEKETRIVDNLKSIPGVQSASLVSYQNDFGV
jgi:uncharacterized membrane protein YhiD involved in acid resistance